MTILRPLSDEDELTLEEATLSLLEQDYRGDTQFIFGVNSELDRAYTSIKRICSRYAGKQISIIADSRIYGPNKKISNLVNMAEHAKNDVLIVSDSDIRVPRNYLSSIIPVLLNPDVGVVSCLYAAVGLKGFWSVMSAMGVSYRFFPNAVFGIRTGLTRPCFGSTLALRRETLRSIGGFEAFAEYLADDYEIGQAVQRNGLQIAYSPATVIHSCVEQSVWELLRHEMRWARTIRVIAPFGYLGTVVTYSFPVSLLFAFLAGFDFIGIALVVISLAARLTLKAAVDKRARVSSGPAILIPILDVFSSAIFIGSLFGSKVRWHGNTLDVAKNGVIRQVS